MRLAFKRYDKTPYSDAATWFQENRCNDFIDKYKEPMPRKNVEATFLQ